MSKPDRVGLWREICCLGGTKEPVWTCENNTKARASHGDAVTSDTCRFQDVEHFIDEDTLNAMNKVNVKQGSKRFKQWIALGKKGKIPSKAWCCQHLKKCRVYIQFCVCLGVSFTFQFGLVSCAGICLVFKQICVCICLFKYIYIYTYIDIHIYVCIMRMGCQCGEPISKHLSFPTASTCSGALSDVPYWTRPEACALRTAPWGTWKRVRIRTRGYW